MNNIRNIGIAAHIDAGKTTVSERILFYAGRIHDMGEVHNGDTVMDDDPREQAKGITINSAATTVYWESSAGKHRINLIDTPGHIDFTMEVERSLRVLDGAVCVLDGSQGVEPQTEQVWRQADRYQVARIIFVNKMDKVGASFAMSVNSLKERLGVKPVAIQLPFGEEDQFQGVIDLIGRRLVTFNKESLGKTYSLSEIPETLIAATQSAREGLIEALAEIDDGICEKFLSGHLEAITEKEIKNALRRGTISRQIFPVLCGSALKNTGIQLLLDAVVDYLPSPDDLSEVVGLHPRSEEKISRKLLKEEPLCALAFKVVSDKNGNLTFLRIYSGTLRTGSYIFNASRQNNERVARLVLVHAKTKEPIDYAEAGSIVAAVGFKSTFTGDTLCDKNAPIILESMRFPEPVVEISVEPKTNLDQDKLSSALQKLTLEDPSLKMALDEETGQTLLRGMGELHLEIVVDKLRTDHGVAINTGRPRVSFKETIIGSASADYKHWRHSGGRGQHGHVVLSLNPGARGSGIVFRSEIVGGAIPKEFIPAIEKGVVGAAGKGILAGYPVVDFEVVVTDGSYHSVDSSTVGFEIAGSMAFQQAAKTAGLVILEPIMSLEVATPEQYLGDVIGSISSREGQVKNVVSRASDKLIEAYLPLRNVFGYTADLRGRTQGRCSPSLSFSHYDICNVSVEKLKV